MTTSYKVEKSTVKKYHVRFTLGMCTVSLPAKEAMEMASALRKVAAPLQRASLRRENPLQYMPKNPPAKSTRVQLERKLRRANEKMSMLPLSAVEERKMLEGKIVWLEKRLQIPLEGG